MDILQRLKSKGHRITKARSEIIQVLLADKNPLSVVELATKLQQKGIKANKTTLYRELEFLLFEKIVKEIQFGENKKRYELTDSSHHHHLVCINCKMVEDIDLVNDLSKQEETIKKNRNFKVMNHSLEFFGLCKNCQ